MKAAEKTRAEKLEQARDMLKQLLDHKNLNKTEDRKFEAKRERLVFFRFSNHNQPPVM
jgi:hypothetical protein